MPESVSVTLSPDKVLRWSETLRQVVEDKVCDQHLAMRLAGRLSFACSIAAGKVGRAYLKPFFAQAFAPLPGGRTSWWLCRAADWWLQCLPMSPKFVHRAVSASRPTVRTWTDAAGASRWLAAVAWTGSRWLWTRLRVPDAVWAQLLPRNDEHIGMQELLAVPLDRKSVV